MIPLKEAITSGQLIILDGAMGSQLSAKGLKLTGLNHNISSPEIVEEVHREYIAAGSNCILANTFTLNRIYAQKTGEMDLVSANKAGVEIAKKAAQGKAYVLGDMGPTGEIMAPYGAGDPDDILKSYYDQAVLLAEYGVDGFMIETVFDLREALIMLKACQEAAPDLPKIVSMTYASLRKGGSTIMGNTAAANAQEILAAGATAVGANCGDLTPHQVAEIVRSMKTAGLPISVKPNAGMPVMTDTGVIYNLGPEEFAAGMKECFCAGATLLGGCCGTTPEYIKVLVDVLGK